MKYRIKTLSNGPSMVRQALAAQALGAAGTMTGEGPFALSLSKGEPFAQDRLVEECAFHASVTKDHKTRRTRQSFSK